MRRTFPIFPAVLLAAWLAAPQAVPWEARKAAWQTLEGCELDPNSANDGDSFHVLHQGREYIFRLYFVDSPETSALVPDRVAGQARYWGIPEAKVIASGRESAQATRALLRRPFTVITRLEDARGQSALPRYYALVRCADGRWLDEALVEAGWVRVYGQSCILPDGTPAGKHYRALDALQEKARKSRRGVWRLSPPRSSRDDAKGE